MKVVAGGTCAATALGMAAYVACLEAHLLAAGTSPVEAYDVVWWRIREALPTLPSLTGWFG